MSSNVINRDLKRLRNKAFFMMRCKHTGETEYNLTKEKKKHIATAGCSFEKKTQDITIFADLISIFQTFPRSGNFWAN